MDGKHVTWSVEGGDLGEVDLPAQATSAAGKWRGKAAPESPLCTGERGSENEEEEEEEEEEEDVSDTDTYPDTDDDVLDTVPSLRMAACGSTDDLLALFSSRDDPDTHKHTGMTLEELSEAEDICPKELPNNFRRVGRQDAIRGHRRLGPAYPKAKSVMVDSTAPSPAPDKR